MSYRDTKISRSLAKLLRHSGFKEGLIFREDGYTFLDDLLNHVYMTNSKTTLEDISRIVENNDKKRFQLLEENGKTFIRATQGHSMNFKNIGYKKIEKIGDYGVFKNAPRQARRRGHYRR